MSFVFDPTFEVRLSEDKDIREVDITTLLIKINEKGSYFDKIYLVKDLLDRLRNYYDSHVELDEELHIQIQNTLNAYLISQDLEVTKTRSEIILVDSLVTFEIFKGSVTAITPAINGSNIFEDLSAQYISISNIQAGSYLEFQRTTIAGLELDSVEYIMPRLIRILQVLSDTRLQIEKTFTNNINSLNNTGDFIYRIRSLTDYSKINHYFGIIENFRIILNLMQAIRDQMTFENFDSYFENYLNLRILFERKLNNE